MISEILFPSKKRIMARIFLFLLIPIAVMGCVLWDLAGERISQEVYSGTYTAISHEQTEDQREIEDDIARDTEWADYNNAESTRQAAEYQTVLAAPSPTPAPPVIISIDVPAEIPGDKSQVLGALAFRDPDGDVNRLVVEVVDAINFGGADYNPRDYLLSGDFTHGVFQIYLWCEGEQYVVLRYTLYDYAGNKSNSMHTNFRCVGTD